jgi:hypothetical protein
MRRLIVSAALAAVATALVLVGTGAAGLGGGSLANYFFGPKLVRAEVLVNDAGTTHDYRVDRGRIRANANGSLTLLERDGTLVTVPVLPTADIRLGNLPVPLSRLKRGFTATTVRDGSAGASIVQATR